MQLIILIGSEVCLFRGEDRICKPLRFNEELSFDGRIRPSEFSCYLCECPKAQELAFAFYASVEGPKRMDERGLKAWHNQ